MNAQAAVPASGRAVIERRGTGLAERLRRAWRNYRTYTSALAALRFKSVREREDIGLAGADLEAVVRDALARNR